MATGRALVVLMDLPSWRRAARVLGDHENLAWETPYVAEWLEALERAGCSLLSHLLEDDPPSDPRELPPA